jgi:hypothetical protein
MMPHNPQKTILPVGSSPKSERKKSVISKASSGEQSNKKRHGLGNIKLGRYSSALAVGGNKKQVESDDESIMRYINLSLSLSLILTILSSIFSVGRTPIEHALLVMLSVYDKAGVPVEPYGLSSYDKLQSLRTEPALEILKNSTWRHFFDPNKQKDKIDSKQVNNNSNNTYNTNNYTYNDTNRSSNKNLRQHIRSSREYLKEDEMEDMKEEQNSNAFNNVNNTFDNMILRVEILWQSVKIPECDKEFYRKSICCKPLQSIDQCREVAKYIIMLQTHRTCTISVLHSINNRELKLQKNYDILSVLNHKYSRDNLTNTNDDNENVLYRNELIESFKELQVSTINVVKCIQCWRRNMWRPQPFIWLNKNYLLKIKDDMTILHAEIYRRQLQLSKIHYDDLLCIWFKENTDLPTNKNISSSSRVPFLNNVLINSDECRSAHLIIAGESSLLQSLSFETASLFERGVFIPILKLIPQDKNNHYSSNQTQNTPQTNNIKDEDNNKKDERNCNNNKNNFNYLQKDNNNYYETKKENIKIKNDIKIINESTEEEYESEFHDMSISK